MVIMSIQHPQSAGLPTARMMLLTGSAKYSGTPKGTCFEPLCPLGVMFGSFASG